MNLVTLALAAHLAAASPFNGLFYAIAATIIPVLFLAIAVHGPMYENLMKPATQSIPAIAKRNSGARTPPQSGRGRRSAHSSSLRRVRHCRSHPLLRSHRRDQCAYLPLPAAPCGHSVRCACRRVILTIAAAAAPTLVIIRFFRRTFQLDKALRLPAPAESSTDQTNPNRAKRTQSADFSRWDMRGNVTTPADAYPSTR
jgi:hypothetical protein